MKTIFDKFTRDALGEALLGAMMLVGLLLAGTFISTPVHADPSIKLKDLADLEGVRDNVLIGYGLVSGLAGTGDSANGIPFTRQSLMNMLERLGVNSKDLITQVKTKNVAAVMVTAKLSSLTRQGSRLDVTVSSLGDAKSLEGGLLLATPLVGADGQVYALAQGAMIVGGFQATGKDGSSISKNHPTVGRIAGGALVEKESGFQLAQLGNSLGILLRQPDFTTAEKVKDSINKAFGEKIAVAEDNSRISVSVPARYQPQLAAIIEKIENLSVVPETEARVVIDEKTGTIVMGQNVRISPVAISHSNLTIKITEETLISQPLSFNVGGQTVAVDRSKVEKVDDDANHGKFQILKGGASLADLVSGLNALGVKPRDVIAILQNIKAAGALQAELVVL
ncbi:MAG TPA: flagellar basal body P-ring protein FlgI [Alphaproteobacteria bacterium]|nr:flagellar basal body P-ring protein FlgI [Alphaproteobacteria bacterium]